MLEFILILALSPVVVIMTLVYLTDSYEPEPKKIVLKVLGFGALTVIPVIIAEHISIIFFPVPLSDTSSTVNLTPLNLFINIFISIALIEETAKFVVVRCGVYRSSEFDEVYDGIVYCCAASLGFAAIENIGYVISPAAMGEGLASIMAITAIGIARAVLAVPAHACFGIIMGYFVGKSKFEKGSMKIVYLLSGLFLASFMHTVYDYFALSKMLWQLLLFMPLMITITVCFQLKAIKQSVYRYNPQQESAPPPEDQSPEYSYENKMDSTGMNPKEPIIDNQQESG